MRFALALLVLIGCVSGTGAAWSQSGLRSIEPGSYVRRDEPQTDPVREMMRLVTPCWRVPVGPATMQVKVAVKLEQDGALSSPPTVLTQIVRGDDVMQRAADNATTAVTRCAPYKLPGDYNQWREITLTFLGGTDR